MSSKRTISFFICAILLTAMLSVPSFAAVTITNITKTAVQGTTIEFDAADFASFAGGDALTKITITTAPTAAMGKLQKGETEPTDLADESEVTAAELDTLKFVPKDATVTAASFQFTATDDEDTTDPATVTITFTAPPPPPPQEIEVLQYRDLAKAAGGSHWCLTSAGSLATLGLMVGEKTHQEVYYFHPEEYLTRSEFTKFLTSVMQINLLTATVSEFEDVKAPYEIDILHTAYTREYAKGTMVGTKRYFYPDRLMTRIEAIQFISNALGGTVPASFKTNYTDKASIPAWGLDAAKKLDGLEIINGSNGKLNPNSLVKRSEAAEMLFKLYKEIEKRNAESEQT